VYGLLVEPSRFAQSPSTQQPVVCDDKATVEIESCTTMIIEAAIRAVAFLESPAGFASDDPATWEWGKLHRLALAPIVRDDKLAIGNFPRAGDRFAVDRADTAVTGNTFAVTAAPAYRIVATAEASTLRLQLSLPGGTIFDSRHPHYRDLLDGYLSEQPVTLPLALADIVAAGEHRWDFE
jgi:acyl-homoserine lactone acylase PvdQ